jgi:hypothetical protein
MGDLEEGLWSTATSSGKRGGRDNEEPTRRDPWLGTDLYVEIGGPQTRRVENEVGVRGERMAGRRHGQQVVPLYRKWRGQDQREWARSNARREEETAS